MRSLAEFEVEVATLKVGFSGAQSDRKKLQPVMVNFFRRMDKALAGVATGLACKAGCSYCCNYHVYISAPEAFALANALDEMPAGAQKDAVFDRLRDNVKVASALSVAQHIATNVRCAFLSDAGRCLAYEVRPGACRRHHSMSVEPCRVTYEDPTSTAENPMRVDVLETAAAFITASRQAVSHVKGDGLQYELHGAVLEASTNKVSMKRWRDGKSAFPSVRDRVDPKDQPNP